MMFSQVSIAGEMAEVERARARVTELTPLLFNFDLPIVPSFQEPGTSCLMQTWKKARTLSSEIFENCGNFFIVEDYAPLFSEENSFLVEMFNETFNIWHIDSL